MTDGFPTREPSLNQISVYVIFKITLLLNYTEKILSSGKNSSRKSVFILIFLSR